MKMKRRIEICAYCGKDADPLFTYRDKHFCSFRCELDFLEWWSPELEAMTKLVKEKRMSLHKLTLRNTAPGKSLSPFNVLILVDDQELKGVTRFSLSGDAGDRTSMKADITMIADWEPIEGLADITIRDTSDAAHILRELVILIGTFKEHDYNWSAVPQGFCISVLKRLAEKIEC